MSTYAREMAERPFSGGRAVPIGPGTIEALILEVIKKCGEVLGERGHLDCDDGDGGGNYIGCLKLRALAGAKP